MLKEQFQNLINSYVEPKFDPELDHKGQPRKNRPIGECNETVAPLFAVKQIAYPCDWCDETCSKEKTYSRSPNSNIWRAKCQDCGDRRQIHTSQINVAK
jgi:hypothetical protein